ncbi:MAG: enoyl-CoA hydratase/carnithine racemase [Saprospiraceae bacterium]|jgi:enoyl-CoA hydratase/carnithine racemase
MINEAPPIVSTEIQDHIATVKLNRPAARNSLSLELIEALTQQIVELGETPTVFVIVLAAEGPAFCAGHDLKELTAARKIKDNGRAFFELTMANCSKLMQCIVRCPKPVIAAVQGTATAAGCQLVASCDLAVASDTAKFATPGVNIGLFCSTPMVALSRNVSRKHAMEMLLLGELVSAEQALQWGLINRVVAPDAVMEQALAMAAIVASKSPTTVATGKEAFYQQLELGLSEAYDYASNVMMENMLTYDAEEGISAFIEKRSPNWHVNTQGQD